MIAMVSLQVKKLREFKTEKIQPCSFKQNDFYAQIQ